MEEKLYQEALVNKVEKTTSKLNDSMRSGAKGKSSISISDDEITDYAKIIEKERELKLQKEEEKLRAEI